jgi:hypothetical protein
MADDARDGLEQEKREITKHKKIPSHLKSEFDCYLQTNQDNDTSDISSEEESKRIKTVAGFVIALFPCLYIVIAGFGGAGFLFDTEGFSIFLHPIANSFIFWVCALPITVYFYNQMDKNHWPLVKTLFLNIAVTAFYFLGIFFYSRLFFVLVWMISGPM